MLFFKTRAILLQALIQDSFETARYASLAVWFGAQGSVVIHTGGIWGQ